MTGQPSDDDIDLRYLCTVSHFWIDDAVNPDFRVSCVGVLNAYEVLQRAMQRLGIPAHCWLPQPSTERECLLHTGTDPNTEGSESPADDHSEHLHRVVTRYLHVSPCDYHGMDIGWIQVTSEPAWDPSMPDAEFSKGLHDLLDGTLPDPVQEWLPRQMWQTGQKEAPVTGETPVTRWDCWDDGG